jgi:hypothetical protein
LDGGGWFNWQDAWTAAYSLRDDFARIGYESPGVYLQFGVPADSTDAYQEQADRAVALLNRLGAALHDLLNWLEKDSKAKEYGELPSVPGNLYRELLLASDLLAQTIQAGSGSSPQRATPSRNDRKRKPRRRASSRKQTQLTGKQFQAAQNGSRVQRQLRSRRQSVGKEPASGAKAL